MLVRMIESSWATFNWAGQAGGPEKFYAGRRKGEARNLSFLLILLLLLSLFWDRASQKTLFY